MIDTKYLIAAGIIFTLGVLKHYFNGGVCRASRDLRNKVAVITGGNTGIGKATAQELANLGCTVIIGARDVEKSRKAVSEIRRHSKNENVFEFELNLGSKVSIEDFVAKIKERFNRIDILVNNAGIMALPEPKQTDDGFEAQMGVNHLGHFYLTYLLWDMLKNSENLRIVNVSSKAQTRNRVDGSRPLVIDFQTMNGTYPGEGPHFGKYNPWYAYSASKMANVLFTQELADRLSLINPTARTISVHPGVVRT